MAFTSQAVSSQGAEFYISSGSGTAITLTGVTKASQAVCTASAAHTLQVGDSVLFSSVTGMPEMSNVRAVVVASATPSFTVNVDSTTFAAVGTAGSATPSTYVKSCEIKSVSGIGSGAAAEIENTTVCSTAKEFVLGLRDSGSLSIEGNYVSSDPFQVAALKAQASGAVSQFKVKLPDNIGTYTKPTVLAFAGYVKSLAGPVIAVDASLSMTAEIRLTGEITTVVRSV